MTGWFDDDGYYAPGPAQRSNGALLFVLGVMVGMALCLVGGG